VREVEKRWFVGWRDDIPKTWKDRKIPEIVERELEMLPRAIEDMLERRERILIRRIKNGGNRELQEQLAKAQQPQETFPKLTVELLDFIDGLPPIAPEGEPSHARFTLQQLAGKKGDTIDQVRARFSPLKEQPFIQVVRKGKSNQPTVYRYVKEKPVATEQENRTADASIVSAPRHPLRFESKELVRHGERQRR